MYVCMYVYMYIYTHTYIMVLRGLPLGLRRLGNDALLGGALNSRYLYYKGKSFILKQNPLL